MEEVYCKLILQQGSRVDTNRAAVLIDVPIGRNQQQNRRAPELRIDRTVLAQAFPRLTIGQVAAQPCAELDARLLEGRGRGEIH